MTTKPPPRVNQFSETSLEKIAYGSVAGIPTADAHDRDRLGYNVWRCITTKRDPLEIAVRTAQARITIGEEEAVQRIREYLKNHGIEI
jgi:hypothetical protein